MRINEIVESNVPQVGDILEVEIGDEIVEAVITAIDDDGIVAETDNFDGAMLIAEARANTASTRAGLSKRAAGSTRKSNLSTGEEEAKKKEDEESWARLMAYADEQEKLKNQDVKEAEYQGHKVKLGKPMQGDVKKFKVYVRNPATGKTIKVNFGDPNMRIKKSNPKRRKSFRARHNCSNPGPRTKARYWSCRKW